MLALHAHLTRRDAGMTLVEVMMVIFIIGLATTVAVMTLPPRERPEARVLREVEAAHEKCQIGSYPFFREGRVGANFVIRSTSAEDLASCVDTLCDGLATNGHDFTPGGI